MAGVYSELEENQVLQKHDRKLMAKNKKSNLKNLRWNFENQRADSMATIIRMSKITYFCTSCKGISYSEHMPLHSISLASIILLSHRIFKAEPRGMSRGKCYDFSGNHSVQRFLRSYTRSNGQHSLKNHPVLLHTHPSHQYMGTRGVPSTQPNRH